MPCYDGGWAEEITRSRIDKDIKDKNNQLESFLCAILNELERRDIVHEVLAEASRNGLIGLVDFYEQHKQDDKSRIAKELHKFSKDEQEIIKELLNKR